MLSLYFNILKKSLILFILAMVIIYHPLVIADGSFIDKVYHPYVQPNEREIEWRWNYKDDSGKSEAAKLRDGAQQHRIAYGQSLNDNWFLEAYLVGERNRKQNFKLTSVELEAIWQITEQGEYDQDWGMLFELEHESELDINEVSSALLVEQQWGRWVGTANLYLIYEWGNKIDNEFETAMALQGRYRYSKALEPAIEFYSSDTSEGIGPVLLGSIKLSGRKKIRWETGIIFGLDNKTADQTLKMLIEYEF